MATKAHRTSGTPTAAQDQCEVDAAFFHLYGLSRDDTDYILGTFEVLERAEIRAHGEFRTRRRVLACYDALAQAAATGQTYISPLGPPRRAQPQTGANPGAA